MSSFSPISRSVSSSSSASSTLALQDLRNAAEKPAGATSAAAGPEDTWQPPVRDNRVSTALLPQTLPWSRAERLGYGLNALVWWTRRLTGERSRHADAQAVAQFLVSKRLWARSVPAGKVSVQSLKKMDIERRFWWMSQEQILHLSAMLTAYANRRPQGSTVPLPILVKDALFPPTSLNL